MLLARSVGAGLFGLTLLLCSAASAAATRPPSPAEAAQWKALVAKAEAARAADDWSRLEKATRKRLAIEERTYGPDASVTAASYSWIGQALVRRGKEAEAEPFYRKALAANRKALGDRDPQTLLATTNLAGLLERQRRFEEAEQLRRELLDRTRALFGPKGAEAAAATVALADVLRAQGRPAEAEPLYQEAVAIDTRLFGEADPRLAADLGALAASLDDLGRYAQAEPLHRRAVSLRRQAFGERDAATAQAYARMAENLDAQGRHAEAEPLHRMALATDRKLRGEAHPATAADYLALGANLDAQKRSREAEPLLRKALAIRVKAFGERDADTGASYGALAHNLALRGKADEAEKLHRRALAITLAARGERHAATATAYAALGGELLSRKRATEAEPYLKTALETRRAVLGERHPATAESYDALAENERLLASNLHAEALSARAVSILRTRRTEELNTTGSNGEAALRRARAADNGAGVQGPILRRYLRLAWLAAGDKPSDMPRLRDAAFAAAQDLDVSPAARALAQTAARTTLTGKPTAAEARVQQELAGQVRELEDKMVQALPDGDPGQSARIGAALDAVGRELADLDARLQRDNPRYAQLAAPPPLTVAQAQKRLKPGEGLLLIVPAGDDVQVFAVSRTKVAWHRMENHAALERRIRALRCGVDSLTCGGAEGKLAAFDLAAAHSLYRDLVAPVEEALTGVDRLFVTASGSFGALPFGLLVTAPPRDGLANAAWLADRYALTTLPAVSSLRATAAPARTAGARNAFVGYGAPVLETDPTKPTFVPIPGAAEELRAMARALGAPAGSLRLGAQATETAIKASPELQRAAVVAFATHGLLSREVLNLEEPGLVLTAGGHDDGVLTASEAAGLTLSADWVILSACNTAGSDGAPGADSLSGLARAFLYAGARALLVTHWRVFDESTAAITVQTLAIQKANPRLTKAQALQRAMKAVRTGRRPDGAAVPGWTPEWAHPAHWAPFVLISAG